MNAVRFVAGFALVLLVAIINLVVVAVGGADASTAPDVVGCTQKNNATTCADVGKTGFFQSMAAVTAHGIDNAPNSFNGPFLFVDRLLLIGGLLLIGLAFIPFTSG